MPSHRINTVPLLLLPLACVLALKSRRRGPGSSGSGVTLIALRVRGSVASRNVFTLRFQQLRRRRAIRRVRGDINPVEVTRRKTMNSHLNKFSIRSYLLPFIAMVLPTFAVVAEDDVKAQISDATMTSMHATIVSIDPDTRMVTLKNAAGETRTLHVDERARNLAQAKPGDIVTVDFYEAFALSLRKATGESPMAGEVGAVALAPLGDKPGVATLDTEVLTGVVVEINYKARTAAVRGPRSNVVRFDVSPESGNLEKIVIGDKVVAEHTVAIAISVDAPAD